jgi:hypothetical protein
MIRRRSSLNAVALLTEQGYTNQEIREYSWLFEQLLSLRKKARLPDTLLTNTTYIINATIRDGVARIDVLKWLLVRSEQLGTMPVRYLIDNESRNAVDEVVMAADAHFDNISKASSPTTTPLDMSNVVSLNAVRNSKRHKR